MVIGGVEHDSPVAVGDRQRGVPTLPETQMSLPALAPPRRSAAPAGTSPMIVTVITSDGPRVVSPPMSDTLYSWARSKKPLAKAESHSWSTLGSVNASIAQ